jgi:Holliday junction resolvase RusA-like endonuclease
MPKVCFTVPGIARGKQRPRATRVGRVYTPAQTVNAEAFVKLCAMQAMHEQGVNQPLEGPLTAIMTVTCEVPKSFPKAKRKAALEQKLYPTGKPDLDNILKLQADAMNGVVYVDDKQLVEVMINKRYGLIAETAIMVSTKE